MLLIGRWGVDEWVDEHGAPARTARRRPRGDVRQPRRPRRPRRPGRPLELRGRFAAVVAAAPAAPRPSHQTGEQHQRPLR